MKPIHICVAIALCLVSCTFVLAQESSCAPCDADGETWDEASGICLPAEVAGLTLAAFPDALVEALADYRNSIIAGYNDELHKVLITIYIYDRESDSEEADLGEFKLAVEEILESHKKSRLEMSGTGSLPIAGQKTDSLDGMFTWYENRSDYVSLLWLVPWSERYVKFRATYVRPRKQLTEATQYLIQSVEKVAESICSDS